MKITSFIQAAADTALSIPRRLRSIDQQLKILTRIKDGAIQFLYEDTPVKIYIPQAGMDTIQTDILDTGCFFENGELSAIRKYIKPGAYIADCGANIGNHTLYFALICRAKNVISFEPQKTCFQILSRNISINNLCDIVVLHNLALGNKTGTMSISSFNPTNCGGTAFAYDEHGDVQVVTFDSLNVQRLDFVKIDVEGGQLPLLEGMKETINRCSPIVWVELLDGLSGERKELEFDKPMSLLTSLGYHVEEQLSPSNYIFMK